MGGGRSHTKREGCARRPALKYLLTVLTAVFVLMVGLGVLRIPFAVRFWQRAQWVAWAYIAVVVLSAVRLAWFT